MLSVELPAGLSFLFNDDPYVLTARRLHRFELAVLQDSGMGTTLEELDAHLSRAMEHVAAGLHGLAFTELENLRRGFHAGIVEGLSTSAAALAELVAEVDGVPWVDFTDAGVERLAALIAERVPQLQVREIVSGVKKNWIPN